MTLTDFKIIVRAWLKHSFGSRCSDFEPTCICCRVWAAYDIMFDMGDDYEIERRADGRPGVRREQPGKV